MCFNSQSKVKKVCIITGTRADWGILSPLAGALRKCDSVDLQIIATNMHLLEKYGHTADEIEKDGFEINANVKIADTYGGSKIARAEAMADCLDGIAKALDNLKPDAVIILGDRFEMLAAASAAAIMEVPIIHLHGGETTEGALDNAFRHAITQLASLHLVATESFREKVITMGADPSKVVNTGSLGVWNMINQPSMSREELAESLGFSPDKRFVVATYHPATLDKDETPRERVKAMLTALDDFPQLSVIIAYPNNDTGSEQIIEEIERWATDNQERVIITKSLGLNRYLSAIKNAEFVIGNSSSGVIEVPSVGTPVINIGIRQKGRPHGNGVIDCRDDSKSIFEAINLALSPDFKDISSKKENPYFQNDALGKCVDAIIEFLG